MQTIRDFDPIEIDDPEEVVLLLERADAAYYGSSGQPIMQDWRYDALKDQLRALDPDHPYLSKVGATPSSAWRKVRHIVPMGSLSKAQSSDELREWWPVDVRCLVSEKLDGISISLTYQGGKLVRAVTRGDGTEGEDITRNVLRMKGIRPNLGNISGSIRGEIVVLKSDFKAHLAGQYANERNAAAGISRRLDGEGCQHLSVFCYQVILDDPSQQAKLDTKAKEFTLIRKLGLSTPWRKVVNLAETVRVYKLYISEGRENLNYLIDGLVVDIDDTTKREELGEGTDGRPKGSVALKFPHATAQTTLRDVVWQTGSRGHVTPVAIMDPVQVSGVMVSQASLYNPGYLGRIKLARIGSTVSVSRRNDVIPRVEAVTSTGTGKRISAPRECPSCRSPVHMDGEILKCDNTLCSAQVRGNVAKWIDTVGLLDWGEAVLDALMRDHGVSEPADIYQVTETQLASLMLVGKKLGASAAKKMISARDSRKSLTLGDAVGALGIPMCGRTTCKDIVAAGFGSLDALGVATVEDLCGIPGIGMARAQSFVTRFPGVLGQLRNLLGVGFEIREAVTGGAFVGETVCFTGFRDRELHEAVEEAGGTMKDGMSRKVTILVADNPNGKSGKLTKARKQGTRVIGVDELRRMLGQ